MLDFNGLPGGPHPVMADGTCVGLGELGCFFLSAWISATGLPFASLSLWVLITDLGQGCVCRGCWATGLLVSAGVPHHWGDMACFHPLP